MTASFLKELLRRAALLAAEESAGALVVGLPQMTAALTELMDTRNAVTRAALGGS